MVSNSISSKTWDQENTRPPDLSEALCTSSETGTRRLLATVRSPEEIFVVTMRPPRLRDFVEIVFPAEHGAGAKPVEALVVETAYRSTEVTACGFVAMTTSPEHVFECASEGALQHAVVRPIDRAAAKYLEKRRDPRVRDRLMATVRLPGKSLVAKVLNLSMSGVLIGFEQGDFPKEMEQGALFRLDIRDALGAVAVAAKAEIIRLIGVGKPTNAGARLIDMNAKTEAQLEEIILGTVLRQQTSAPSDTPDTP
jgi:hypothetical protein